MWHFFEYYCRSFRKISLLPYYVDPENLVFCFKPYKYKVQRILQKLGPCLPLFYIVTCAFHLIDTVRHREKFDFQNPRAIISLIMSLYIFFITSALLSFSHLLAFKPFVALNLVNPFPVLQESIKGKKMLGSNPAEK